MPTAAKAAPFRTVRAKVTSKGQITVPVQIRRSQGIKPGDHLRFEHRKDEIGLVRDSEENVFEKWRGIRTGFPIRGKGKDAVVTFLRELSGHDDLD